jgi:cytochrome c biogenesis protein CcdA
MKKILTTIAAIILGILSTLTLGGIGLLIIVTTAGIVALIIAIILLLGGILTGYKIFKIVQNKGTSDFIASSNASPDLDNPNSSDSTHKR